MINFANSIVNNIQINQNFETGEEHSKLSKASIIITPFKQDRLYNECIIVKGSTGNVLFQIFQSCLLSKSTLEESAKILMASAFLRGCTVEIIPVPKELK